ncbi:MAG: hypothetical protein IJ153_05975 [Clostridia bacterium]|nr:hypothetical protein [Clostridia bacterium]
MHALYNEQDLAALRKQIKIRWFGFLAIFLIAVVALALLLISDNHKENRPELITTLVLILSGGLLIFYYDLLIRPLRAYERHMDTALHGRSHQVTVLFDHLNEESSLVEGVNYRDLIFLGEADKHGDRERMFYWDMELPLPDFKKGQEITLTYFDRFITAFSLA